MDTRRSVKKSQAKINFKKNSLIHKAVASFAIAFFVFYGIPMPTSFAKTAPLTKNETQQLVPTVTLAQANAKFVRVAGLIPSGAAIQLRNPLSRSTSLSRITRGPAPAVVNKTSSSTVINKNQAPAVTTRTSSPVVVNKTKAPAVTTRTSSPVVVNKAKAPAVTTRTSSPVVVNKTKAPAVINPQAPTGGTLISNFNFPSVTSFASLQPSSSATLTQKNSDQFSVQYDVNTAGSYAGIIYSFDDFGTEAVETYDLTSVTGISFALRLASGSGSVKLEIEDQNRQKAEFFLADLSTTERNISLPISAIQTSYPAVDLQHIRGINFVIENTRVSDKNSSIEVRFGRFPYTPVINSSTTAPVTDFIQLHPSVTPVEAVSGTTVTHFTQSSGSQFSFDYNLSAGGSQRWAAGMILFQPGQYFNAASSDIVLDVNVTGASSYKLEVQDINGVKVTLKVTVTNGKVAVTNALLQSAGVPGFDATKVKAIVLVVDDPSATTGVATVRTMGLNYVPVVQSTPYPDSSSSTLLPGLPVVGVIRNPDIDAVGRVSQEALGGQYVRLDFNVSQPDAFAGIAFNFDAPADLLSGNKELSFGARGGAGIDIKMEIETLFNGVTKKDYVILKDITDITAVKYTVTGVLFESLNQEDLAHIKAIRFIVDRNLSPQEQSTFYILQRGAAYAPVVSGTPYNAALLRALPDQPIVNSGNGSVGGIANGTITMTQASSRNFNFQYTLADNDDFVFAYASNGYLDGTGLFRGMPMNLGSSLTLAANGPAGKQLKVEVKDANGAMAIYYLNLTGSNQNYTLNLIGMNINPSSVAQVTFVADKEHMGGGGLVSVEMPGLAYTSVIDPGLNLGPSDVSTLSGIRNLISIDSSGSLRDGTSSVTQPSSSLYALNYVLGNTASWAVGLTAFDDYGTAQIETKDFTALSDIVVGVAFSQNGVDKDGDVKVEFEDINGKKGIVYLRGGAGVIEYFYRIPMSQLLANNPQLDLAQIKNINFVVEGTHVQTLTGQMQVRLGGYPYITPLQPDPSATSADITGLPSSQITVVSTTGAIATAALTSNGVKVTYDTGTAGWAGGGVTFDDFRTPALESADLSGRSEFVFSLKGDSSTAKLEFVDVNGDKASVRLTGIVPDKDNIYRIPADAFKDVDLAHMRIIYVIVEGDQKQGQITFSHVATVPTPRITQIPMPTNNYTLQFTSVTNGTYQIQYRDGLSGSWKTATSIVANGNSASWTDDGTLAGTHPKDVSSRFYRVAATGLAPAVPSGWTRAAVNTNYAYRLHYVSSTESSYIVELQDVRTGQIVQAHAYDAVYGSVTSVDVSADERHVSFLWNDAHVFPAKDTLHFRRMQDLNNVNRDWSTVPTVRVDVTGLASMNIVYTDLYTAVIGGEKTTDFTPLWRMSVPSGWTRAASNGDFAFKTTPFQKEGGMNYQRLEIMDLRTGQMRTIEEVSVERGGSPFTGVVDIHPDGGSMIYENENMNMGQKTLTVYSLTGAFAPMRIYDLDRAKILGVEFSSGHISVRVGPDPGYRTTNGAFEIDLTNASYRFLPELPEGWTRAASNPNFAFQQEARLGSDRNNYTVLKVQDLSTGTVQELCSLQVPPFHYSVMDVSADGRLVYFGAGNNYTTPHSGWFKVQKVSDPSRQTVITGEPVSAGFLTSGDVTVTFALGFSNGTEIGNVYTVDRNTLQSVLSYSRLVAQGSAVLDEGYLIIPEQNTYSNTFTVTVYDASAGTDHLIRSPYSIFYHASQAGGGSSGSGTYRTVDIFRTSGGKAVLTVGISAVGNADVDFSATHILNLATGASLMIPGAAESVTYQGNVATYTLSHTNGATEKKYVDLEILQFVPPPVPDGWTRAASNAAYAYRAVFVSSPDAPNFYQFEVIELSSGKIVVGGRVTNARGGEDFTGFFDVSQDGKYSLYESMETSAGQKRVSIVNLQNTSQPINVQIGRAALEAVQYSTDQITIQVGAYPDDGDVRGEYRVKLSTGEITFYPALSPGGYFEPAEVAGL